jgi:hypothetical protein
MADIWTNNDYAQAEYESNLHESYRDAALESFYADCRKIYLETQHLVVDGKIDIDDLFKVADAIKDIQLLSWGYEWQNDLNLDLGPYDFTEEGKLILSDEFGFVEEEQ